MAQRGQRERCALSCTIDFEGMSIMTRMTLMEKVSAKAKTLEIKEDQILHIIELSEHWIKQPEGSTDRMYAFYELGDYVNELSVRERYDLFCLMDFGRDLAYNGFCQSAANSFIEKVSAWNAKKPREFETEYLIGKLPLGKWLRLAGKEIYAETQPDSFFRIVRYKKNDKDEQQDYENEDESWKVFRDLVSAQTAEECSSIHLMGYSWSGRAETHMVSVNFY